MSEPFDKHRANGEKESDERTEKDRRYMKDLPPITRFVD